MLLKLFFFFILFAVVVSMISRLFVRSGDRERRSKTRRNIRMLTTRIALSLVVFAVLVLGYHWGWYLPGAR